MIIFASQSSFFAEKKYYNLDDVTFVGVCTKQQPGQGISAELQYIISILFCYTFYL